MDFLFFLSSFIFYLLFFFFFFREKRLAQERELANEQIAQLNNQLSKSLSELQQVRFEASTSAYTKDTRLEQLEKELKISTEEVKELQAAIAAHKSRCDVLSQKLEEQREQEIKMNALYQEQVAAKEKVVKLQTKAAEDAKSKNDDYISCINKLQELLSDATKEYGVLETKYNDTLLVHKQEIEANEQKITELESELTNANTLLEAMKEGYYYLLRSMFYEGHFDSYCFVSENLNQSIENLSPSAAVANRLMNSNMTFSQCFTRFIEVKKELAEVQEVNDQLQNSLVTVLDEVRLKAPILAQKERDCEMLMSELEEMRVTFNEISRDKMQLEHDADEAKKQADVHVQKNKILTRNIDDLTRQVHFQIFLARVLRLL